MVDTLFIHARWVGDVSIPDEILDYVKKKGYGKLAYFASIQFLDVEGVKNSFSVLPNVEILTTKAKRTDDIGQILGCDSYHDSFSSDIIKESDALLYVGDGNFHTHALLLSQGYSKLNKEIIIWDPVNKKMSLQTTADLGKTMSRIKGRILKYLMADVIGILVTIKSGQMQLKSAELLKEKIEKKGKKAFLFIDNTFNFAHMEDYNFIDCWVNTACPRIGQDDDLDKPILNIKEALDPEKFLELLS